MFRIWKILLFLKMENLIKHDSVLPHSNSLDKRVQQSFLIAELIYAILVSKIVNQAVLQESEDRIQMILKITIK